MKRLTVLLLSILPVQAGGEWSPQSPRQEIRPQFSGDEKQGLIISHDGREGLDGWWERTFETKGGTWYRFKVQRKTDKVSRPRQSCLVRIRWEDQQGKFVPIDERPPLLDPHLPMPSAEPEYPTDGPTDAAGWTEVAGVFRCPTKAVKAVVELHLQWAPGGRVEWRQPTWAASEAPTPRKIRLAAAHYKPSGKSPEANCEEFAPLLAEAERKHVDLLVMGETIPSFGFQKELEQIAEPVPGKSTEYFGRLAKQHHLHLAFSLNERDGHLIYNTAVLLGPEGKLIGKYRKTSLPPSEAADGVAPGHEFPVFDTAIGKIGLMVCYDGFFPEVARELTKNGAEVIAWPVYGCNPLLAKARACENHVFLVSSTYMPPESGWMISAVFDQAGNTVATTGAWGTLAVAEVTLNAPYLGPYNLGDFRAMLPRHRPQAPAEK